MQSSPFPSNLPFFPKSYLNTLLCLEKGKTKIRKKSKLGAVKLRYRTGGSSQHSSREVQPRTAEGQAGSRLAGRSHLQGSRARGAPGCTYPNCCHYSWARKQFYPSVASFYRSCLTSQKGPLPPS